MKAFGIVIIVLFIIEAVILAGCIGDIAKALRKGIKLTAFGMGLGYVILCTALAAANVFFAAVRFSSLSECRREIQDYRERGSVVYTEKYEESSIAVTIIDEEQFVAHKISELEESASNNFTNGLIKMIWSEILLVLGLRELIFVTDKGIVRIGKRKSGTYYADREEGRLRINCEGSTGAFPVCKVKDTPKNREILNPYIR